MERLQVCTAPSQALTEMVRSSDPTDGEDAAPPRHQRDDISNEASLRKSQVRGLNRSYPHVGRFGATSDSRPSATDKKNNVKTVTRQPVQTQQRKAVKIRYPTGEEKFVLINSSTRVTSGILTSYSQTGAKPTTAISRCAESECQDNRHNLNLPDELINKLKQADGEDFNHQENHVENSKLQNTSVSKPHHMTKIPSSQQNAVFCLGEKIAEKSADECGVPLKKLKVKSGQMVTVDSKVACTEESEQTSSATVLSTSTPVPASVESCLSGRMKLETLEADSRSVCTDSNVSQQSTAAGARYQSNATTLFTTSTPISAMFDPLTAMVDSKTVSVTSDLSQHPMGEKSNHKKVTSLTPPMSNVQGVVSSKSTCTKSHASQFPSSQKRKHKTNTTSLTSTSSTPHDVVMYLRDEWNGDCSSRTVMYLQHQYLETKMATFLPIQQQQQQSQETVSLSNPDGKCINATAKQCKHAMKESVAPSTCNTLNAKEKNPKPCGRNPTPKQNSKDSKHINVSDNRRNSESEGNNASQKCDVESGGESDYVERLISMSHRAYYVAGSQVVRHNGVTWCRSRVITVYHCQLGLTNARGIPPYLSAVLVYDSNPSLAILIVARICPGVYLVESTHSQLVQRKTQRQHVYERALLKPYPMSSLELLPENVSDFCLAVGPVEQVWRRASARLAAIDMTQSVMGVLRQITGNRECRCFASTCWQQMGAAAHVRGKNACPRKKKLLTLKQLDGRLQRLALFNCSCPECDPFKRKSKRRFLVAKEKLQNIAKCKNNQKTNKRLRKSYDAECGITKENVTVCDIMTQDITCAEVLTSQPSGYTMKDSRIITNTEEESATANDAEVNLKPDHNTIESVKAEKDDTSFDIEVNVESDDSQVCLENVDETDVYVDVTGSPESSRSAGSHSINPESSRSASSHSINPESSRSAGSHSINPESSRSASSHSINPESSRSAGSHSINPESSRSASSHSINPESSRSAGSHSINPESSRSANSHSINPESSRSAGSHSINPESSRSAGSHSINPESSRSAGSHSINPESSRSASSHSINSKASRSASSHSIKPEYSRSATSHSINPESSRSATSQSINPESSRSATSQSINPKSSRSAGSHSINPEFSRSASSHSINPESSRSATSQSINPEYSRSAGSHSINPESSRSASSHSINPESSRSATTHSINPESSRSASSHSINPESSRSAGSQSINPESSRSATSQSINPKSSRSAGSHSINPESSRSASSYSINPESSRSATSQSINPESSRSASSHSINPESSRSASSHSINPESSRSASSHSINPESSRLATSHSINPESSRSAGGHGIKPESSRSATSHSINPESSRSAISYSINPESSRSATSHSINPESSRSAISHSINPVSSRSASSHSINVTGASQTVLDTAAKSEELNLTTRSVSSKPSFTELCVTGTCDSQTSDHQNDEADDTIISQKTQMTKTITGVSNKTYHNRPTDSRGDVSLDTQSHVEMHDVTHTLRQNTRVSQTSQHDTQPSQKGRKPGRLYVRFQFRSQRKH